MSGVNFLYMFSMVGMSFGMTSCSFSGARMCVMSPSASTTTMRSFTSFVVSHDTKSTSKAEYMDCEKRATVMDLSVARSMLEM